MAIELSNAISSSVSSTKSAVIPKKSVVIFILQK
jgi:hypothetical protein